MRSFGLSIGFVLLAIKASATPLANTTNHVERDSAMMYLYTDTECKDFFYWIADETIEPKQNSGCLQPSKAIGSVSFAGDYLGFKLWVDGYCMQEQKLISDGGGCYAFDGYTTANGYSWTD